MSLYDQIVTKYPELENSDLFKTKIILQNDGDDAGDYIVKWEYVKPLPTGLKLGK